MDNERLTDKLKYVYDRLFKEYGPQHWWPAGERFEVIAGAILTQSTAWTNVEKAIINLKAAGKLSPPELRRLTEAELAGLIRPCGYYNVKARRLKAFADWFGEHYDDDLDRLFDNGEESVRTQLLNIYGIGEETADSIILYAGNKPVFVIDAYTRRIVDRLGITPGDKSYRGYQRLFTSNLPADTKLFNEYHALLVHHGKQACRKRPLCHRCCLREAPCPRLPERKP
jgi:endonuclease-3 related protein